MCEKSNNIALFQKRVRFAVAAKQHARGAGYHSPQEIARQKTVRAEKTIDFSKSNSCCAMDLALKGLTTLDCGAVVSIY